MGYECTCGHLDVVHAPECEACDCLHFEAADDEEFL